jgi:hypothetical protein
VGGGRAGNTLIIGFTTAIVYALTYAGTEYHWSDAHVLTPFIIGIAGIFAFGGYESSPLAQFPTIPPHLFANRTFTIGFFVTCDGKRPWVCDCIDVVARGTQQGTAQLQGISPCSCGAAQP